MPRKKPGKTGLARKKSDQRSRAIGCLAILIAVVAVVFGNRGDESRSSLNDPPMSDVTDRPSVRATITPRPDAKLRTPTPESSIGRLTYYVTGTTRVRDCPRTTCDIITTLTRGATIVAIGRTEGESVTDGNPIWYETVINGQTGYVYSGLVSLSEPSTLSLENTSTQQAVTWQCSGDIYNCDSFRSRSEMNSYFNACPGDPSNLDGNADGRPCE